MHVASNEADILVVLGDLERSSALRADVYHGLTATPKQLPPRWLYDERGCQLFDAITELEEYYPTRREHQILVEHVATIAELCRVDTMVELGSGASPKTRLLLDALSTRRALRSFVALDIAESALRVSFNTLALAYPNLELKGVVADFEQHLTAVPDGDRRLFAFLGGTIGNLEPAPRHRFLSRLAAVMHPGEFFLVGTDLVKDRTRLISAYDDAQGVTAAFNRNVLCFLNRELGANFDTAAFEHVARFDEENSWIEMRLRSHIDQLVALPSMELLVPFARGEDIRTEISTKFTTESIRSELEEHELEPVAQWTDSVGDFALTLAHRA